MYLAGVSVRRVEDITDALWGARVSNESSGAPQKRTKLAPPLSCPGAPGQDRGGGKLVQLSVSFVRPYSRIFRVNSRGL